MIAMPFSQETGLPIVAVSAFSLLALDEMIKRNLL